MEKKEKVILVGGSGSGKDFLLRGLVKLGLKYIPKFTTRPKRKLETEGVEYNFLTLEEYLKLKQDNLIKVYQEIPVELGTWYYGITNNTFYKSQVFIMTPNEIEQLNELELSKCFVVYLDIDEEIRRNRIGRRNDNNDSIERRIKADYEDFKDFKKYDLKITDSEFEASWIYSFMV